MHVIVLLRPLVMKLKRVPKQPKHKEPEAIKDACMVVLSDAPLELRVEQARKRLYLTRYE